MPTRTGPSFGPRVGPVALALGAMLGSSGWGCRSIPLERTRARAEPRPAARAVVPLERAGRAALEPAPSASPESSADPPADGIAGWGDSPWCTGASADVRPAPCTDPAGCYKLDLNDLRIEVVETRGRGVTLDAMRDRYTRAWSDESSGAELKGCFAYELSRGRPPTGRVLVSLSGKPASCAGAETKIVERSTGQKTAECVRDILRRLPLPDARDKLVRVDVEVSVGGL